MSEGEIGHLKKRFPQNMVPNKFPNFLWDYGLVHQAGIFSSIACGETGRTGINEVNGQTPDISEWLDFEFYYCLW